VLTNSADCIVLQIAKNYITIKRQPQYLRNNSSIVEYVREQCAKLRQSSPLQQNAWNNRSMYIHNRNLSLREHNVIHNSHLYPFTLIHHVSTTAGNHKYTAKTVEEPQWPQSKRKPSARHPRPSADKSICRTAEKRRLNCTSGNGEMWTVFDHWRRMPRNTKHDRRIKTHSTRNWRTCVARWRSG